MNVVVEQKKKENESELENTAFLGWMFNISQPRGKEDKAPSFTEFMKMIGLKDLAKKHNPDMTEDEIKSEKEKAMDNAAKVISLLRR